jgi:hypothetical protein
MMGKTRRYTRRRHCLRDAGNDMKPRLQYNPSFEMHCHSERPRVFDPPKGMKINYVVTPAKAGPLLFRNTMDSRFRGNDVIFKRAKRGTSPWLYGVISPTQSKIPRFAWNDGA